MKVRINGRVQVKDRSLREVLNQARNALDANQTFHVEKNNRWIEATEVLQFGVVAFSDGTYLDGLDGQLRMNPTWR
jgi:hypothetical protein